MDDNQLTTDQPNRFRTIATASVVAAISAFVIMMISESALKNMRETVSGDTLVTMAITTAAVCVGLLVTGFICGVVSLAGAFRHGRKGILGKGISGLLISFLLLAIFIPNFLSARKSAQENSSVIAIAENMRSEHGEEPLDPEAANDVLSATHDAFAEASENSGGMAAEFARVGTGYTKRMQDVLAPYAESFQSLQEAEPLNTESIKSVADIETKKAAVNRFIASNLVLKEFMKNGENVMKEELGKSNLTDSEQKEFLLGFSPGYKQTLPVSMEIRDLDNQLGEAILDALNLLQNEWGKWEYDSADEAVQFESETAADDYNNVMVQLADITDEQTAAEQKLAIINAKLSEE